MDFPGKRYVVAGRHVATIGGVPIFVGPGILVPMILGMLPKLPQGVGVAIFTAVMVFVGFLAHEAGHAIVARRGGLRVEVMSFGAGAFVFCDASVVEMGVRVFAAGPICNLAIAAALAAILTALGPHGPGRAFVETAMQVNLLLGISNLLPAYSLDGGYIGCLLLSRLMPSRWASTIVGSLGLLFEAFALVMPVALPVMGWPLVWSFSGSSLDLLRWTWRTPPRQPQAQAASDRPVPDWLIRRPPAVGEEAGEPRKVT